MTRSTQASRRACAGSLALLALLALAGGCGTTAGRRPRARPAAPQPHVDARAVARFALLRTRPEGLPARTRGIWRAPIAGMDPRRAQRMPVVLAGAYWLVPGEDYLCIVAQRPDIPGVDSVCAGTAQTLRHGIAITAIGPGRPGGSAPARLIVGVAPDGAREVLVRTRGSVATVPVVDGLFVRRDALGAPPDDLVPR